MRLSQLALESFRRNFKPFVLAFVSLFLPAVLEADTPAFHIQVVDQESQWPVPLVKLTTTGNQTFITDNDGLVTIDSPELLGQEVWFTVKSDGYAAEIDGFKNRGFRVTVTPGKSHTFSVNRTSIAKRLGRLTGSGLFAEAQKSGRHLSWKESGLTGCDSIQSAYHRDQKFWIWGDTNLPHYPLGIFNAIGATTTAKPLSSLEPPLKIPYSYFRDRDQRPRGLAPFAGSGPTWLSGLVSLPDQSGTPHLVATFVKIRNFLDVYRLGLCRWDEAKQSFVPLKTLWEHSPESPDQPLAPEGHAVIYPDQNGKKWLYFGDPFPHLRMPATFEAWQDSSAWEILTPQKQLTGPTGKKIIPHRGSIAWNDYRQKWLSIFTQKEGQPSPLGEIWLAEADLPTGPWKNPVKVLSHQSYTFYNPLIHADLTSPKSPVLLFEGTYTSLFSKSEEKTPRYDYNQILYRIDLDDPKLNPLGK